jgi:hypothetical protein
LRQDKKEEIIMVITLTTGCVIAVCTGLGLFGAGKGVKAAMDNSDANDTNKRAQGILDGAKRSAEKARDGLKRWLTQLGNKRIFVRKQPIARFIETFMKIRNFNVKDLPLSKEPLVQKFDVAEIKADELKFMSMLAGAAGGLAAGGAMAFGAFGAVGTFAAASTGTAIASLSGVAATNATLAWLGGGAIAAGGGGMAAGMAVLGGLVAGPALAIFGCVVGAKASAKLDQAKSNLAKARKVAAELATATTALKGLSDQAALYLKLTNEVCELFIPQLDGLVSIVDKYGTDYMKYSEDCQKRVVATVSTYQVLRALVDSRIMKDNGSLDNKSNKVAALAQKFLAAS